MRKIKTLLILLLVFIAACWLAMRFESSYRELIRYLYVTLSNGAITFRHAGKQFYFNFFFEGFFGVFATIAYYMLSKHNLKTIVIHLLVAFIIFAGLTAWSCYWDGYMKVMVCTACKEGKLALHYNDLNYNKLFATSLITALLPLCIVEYKRRKKNKALNH